jgi:PPIC-type PPIASE domain
MSSDGSSLRLLGRGRWLALLFVAACGSHSSATEVAHIALGGDTVALVGKVPVSASLVAEVVKAQKVSPREALDLVVDDALAAAGAEAAGLARTPEVVRATRAAEARKIVLGIREAAKNAGPPTDEELKEVTENHWVEVDLPEQMLVIHALVMKPTKLQLGRNPRLDVEAVALANALAATEASATSADDFEARAKALPHGDLEIKVERLDPFVADGRRSTVPGGTFKPEFARGAAPLAVGATSGIVATEYGWHVIRMLERLPEHRVPLEERRQLFREEVVAMRARRALDKLEEELVAKFGVTISNGVEDLMTEGTMSYLGIGRDTPSPSP